MNITKPHSATTPTCQQASARFIVLLIAAWLTLVATPTFAASKNGFDLTNASIAVNEILAGGPPKDGIPALTKPKFVDANKAQFLSNDDRVLGIAMNGVAKAYPIKILNWHEIVNDSIGDTDFAVTYCPLCGTGVAFLARAGGKTLDFGVSGLLYNSDVLLYDKRTNSLWSQILGKAVSGPMLGTKLKRLALRHTTWENWQKLHPNTRALSTDTGFARDYNRNPYAGYEKSRRLFFKVATTAPELYHPKEVVLGLEANGHFKAYPAVELNKHGRASFVDRVGGEKYTIHWDVASQSGKITDSRGSEVAMVQSFWFAWFAFHPKTAVFKAKAK